MLSAADPVATTHVYSAIPQDHPQQLMVETAPAGNDGIVDGGPLKLPDAEPVADDIVVTAERYGKARVDAETEFDEAAIGAHGADSIQDLLQKLAPWMDPSGEEPILLINGEPAGYDRSILGYPAEALMRLELLKPEAANEYGQPAGKRVVNLVLKRQFSSLNADVGAEWATAGGQGGQRLSIARTAINGRLRWNIQARMSRNTALWKHKRKGRAREGIFDHSGLIKGVAGGEVDPDLSDLVGSQVDFTALPLDRDAEIWELEEFAALAGRNHPLDPARYETLLPSRRSASLSMGLTRPLGGWNLSVNLQANQSHNLSHRGPAMAQTLWRGDDAASPFSQDVLLIRPVGEPVALTARSKSQSLGASIGLNGKIAGWQSNLGINVNRSWSESALDSGVDEQGLQAAQDDGRLPPLAILGAEWLARSRNAGRSDNLSAQLNVQRPIITLPAGAISLSMGANGSLGRSQRSSWDGDEGPPRRDRSGHQQGQAQASLNIPVHRDGEGLLPLPINLSFDLSASVSASRGSRTQKRWSTGVNMEPWRWLQLRGSIDRADMAPGFAQLEAVREEQVQRVFDYARQEMAEVIWVTGGNPDLKRGRQQSVSVSAMVRPLLDPGLTFNFSYRRSESRNGITSMPELTPEVERAFSDRVLRDAEGRLTAIDARPVNLLSESQSSVSSSMNLRWPMATSAPPGAGAWQFQGSINHNMRLTAERQIRAGLPVINLLRSQSGQSLHNLSMQLTASRTGLGATLSGSWSSGGRLAIAENGDGALRFKPPLTLNLSAHLEPEKLWPSAKENWLWKGLKLSFDVQNITRAYRRVLLEDGSAPPGFSRDDVDPLGRVMRLQLRKKF